MTIRRPTDPERFRVTWANGRRFYVDREPADDRWGPTEKNLPNCTSIAKCIGSDAFFEKVGDTRVPLDALRVADYAIDNWDRLGEMRADERRHALASSAGRDLARAADRGTAVHAYIEALLRSETPLLLEPDAEPYRDIAERVAADFAPLLTHQEVVGFRRSEFTPDEYGGTFDAIGPGLLLDWKTRGPDAKHGCYEKEVAQLGLGMLCNYYFDIDADGTLVRVPWPDDITELLVVSIRPDSYEVYPVDRRTAMDAAERALEVHAAKSGGASLARKAVGTPRPMPSDGWSATDLAAAGEAVGIIATEPTESRTTEWLLARYAAVLDLGVDKATVAAAWPAGVPGPKRSAEWDAADIAEVAKVLERIEDAHAAAFPPPDPDQPPTPPRRSAPAKVIALRERPADGDDVDDAAVAELRERFAAMDETDKTTTKRWVLEGARAGRDWNMARHRESQRRYAVSAAAVELAPWGDSDGDDAARALIATVIGEDACQRHPVGALLGVLTIEEAETLARIAAAAEPSSFRVSDGGEVIAS